MEEAGLKRACIFLHTQHHNHSNAMLFLCSRGSSPVHVCIKAHRDLVHGRWRVCDGSYPPPTPSPLAESEAPTAAQHACRVTHDASQAHKHAHIRTRNARDIENTPVQRTHTIGLDRLWPHRAQAAQRQREPTSVEQVAACCLRPQPYNEFPRWCIQPASHTHTRSHPCGLRGLLQRRIDFVVRLEKLRRRLNLLVRHGGERPRKRRQPLLPSCCVSVCVCVCVCVCV